MLSRAFPLVLALFATSSRATVDIQCADPTTKANVEAALSDAIRLAANAQRLFTQSLPEDWVKTAALLTFDIDDVPEVNAIYQKIQDIQNPSSQKVTIFCNEDTIQWNDGFNAWADTTYTATDASGQVKTVPLNTRAGNRDVKPGNHGAGYKIPLGNGEIGDCTGQAHIFLSQARLNPPPGRFDTRSFDTIVNDGLDPAFCVLDTIHPLAQTVLHEMVHVVGGLQDSTGTVGAGKITDGPYDDVYGLANCFKARMDNSNCQGSSTLGFADPYVVAAKMLYLQIRGRNTLNIPVYWHTTKVDPYTLEAVPVA